MTRRVLLRPEAQAEFDEAFDWYGARRPGLGVEFAESVQQVLGRIAANPLVHGVVRRDVRCALVRRFPYGVYYQIDENDVIVLAIFHGSRDPRVWQARADG